MTERLKEKLAIAVAWALPRRIAYWAFIRVSTNGEQGNPGETKALDAANRWRRASNGDLVLASYTGRHSDCWIWSLSLSRERRPFRIVPRSERRNQWHHFLPLPFGRTLILGRQDYHRDPRHRKSA